MTSYSKKRRPGALFRNGGRPRGWIESTLTAHMARTALRPHSRFGPCRPKETGGTGGLPSDAGVGFSVPLSAPGKAVHMGELGHWCDAALSKNGGDPSHREFFALSLWYSRDLWCGTPLDHGHSLCLPVSTRVGTGRGAKLDRASRPRPGTFFLEWRAHRWSHALAVGVPG